MAEDHTTNVARGRLHSGRAKLSEFVTNQICYVFGSLAEVTTADTAVSAAHEDRVDDGRSGTMDVYRSTHFGWTRNCGGTSETSIQYSYANSGIGFEFIMMEGKGERRTGFQSTSDLSVDSRQSVGEMVYAPSLRRILRKLFGRTGSVTVEAIRRIADQSSEPSVAKVHQFGVLDIPEIRGIGKHCVEALRGQLHGGRAGAANRHVPATRSIDSLADPLPPYRNKDLSAALVSDFEWRFAILFGLGILLHDIGPTA